MSVMNEANRGWLLTISHNTRSRELYMRLSSGILKQTEERTFWYKASFICATLWSTVWRPEIQLSGKQLDKLMKERSVESFSIWWCHCRLQVRQSPCHCLLEAGSWNKEKFHSVISSLLIFSSQVSAVRVRQNEWTDIWAELLQPFLCFCIFKCLSSISVHISWIKTSWSVASLAHEWVIRVQLM